MPRPGHLPAEQLDDAPCGLLTTDRKGLILQTNSTFCRWLGYAPVDLIGRKRLQQLLTMGGRIFHQTHLAPLLEMQGSVSEVKLDLQQADGGVIPVVLNAITREIEGEVRCSVALFIARDRDTYERELLASRAKLEAAVIEATELQEQARDRALFAEQMVGIVSHDLRNPLSAISTGIEVLQLKDPAPAQVKVLGLLARSARRARNLIEDLLDFTAARVGAGLSVTPAPIDLHDTVSHAVEELAMAFPGRRLEHQRSGEGVCTADAKRLAQAIGNLVSNAVSYGDPASAVAISSTIDALRWTISVHNFGPPIADDRQASLFQPMVRGEAAAGSGRNVGLGLFIVSEIAKAHHGEVVVRSSEEDGTTFQLIAPVPDARLAVSSPH